MGIQLHPLSLSRLHHLLRHIQADMAYILYSSSKYIHGRFMSITGMPSAAEAGFDTIQSRGADGCLKQPVLDFADSMVDFLSGGVVQPVNGCVAGPENRLAEALQAGSTAEQVSLWSVSAVPAKMLVLNRYEVSGC